MSKNIQEHAQKNDIEEIVKKYKNEFEETYKGASFISRQALFLLYKIVKLELELKKLARHT